MRVQFAAPSEISSKSASTFAVKPKSKIVEKLATKKSLTIFPMSVGTNFPLSEPTFSISVLELTVAFFNKNCSYFRSTPSTCPFST